MDKITWLGQAGLLCEKDGFRIMIDPYLSDSVVKVNPKNYRRVPVDTRFFDLKPDVMIFTHDHLDHYDPETVPHFINKDTTVLVLAPTSVWDKVRKIGGKKRRRYYDLLFAHRGKTLSKSFYHVCGGRAAPLPYYIKEAQYSEKPQAKT